MANWEFFDNQTIGSTKELVDDLRAGKSVKPTRGADTVVTFKEVSRVLAGFDDGRAGEGVGAGEASLIGLRLANRRGWTAPGEEGSTDGEVAPDADDDAPGLAPGRPSSADSTANEPDRAHAEGGEHPADATAATPASDKTDGTDGIDGTATKGGTA
jgi:NADH-quinone oxidoreductase subunit E